MVDATALLATAPRLGLAGTSSVQEQDDYVVRKLLALIDSCATSGSTAGLLAATPVTREAEAVVRTAVDSASDEARLDAARARWKQEFSARVETQKAIFARFPAEDVPTPGVTGDD